MAELLTVEREMFDQNVEEWRSSHLGKFVLIKDKKVVGFYESLDKAFNEGIDQFGMDDFFIEQILPSDSINISFVGQVV